MNNNDLWFYVYSEEFFNAPDCWKTCDSYCCTNFHGEYFKMMDKKGVVLPFLHDEYEHFKSIGGIKNITSKPKERNFALPDGKSFSMYFLTCHCQGLCDPHLARPLVCRIYPYFPVVNFKGDLLDFNYVALMDIFYKNESSHPCTLVRENSSDIKNQLRKSLQPILKYPKIVFAFMATKLIIDYFRKDMGLYLDEIPKDEFESFFRKYEWSVLSGKPWNNNEFKDDISNTYKKIKDHFGDFDI